MSEFLNRLDQTRKYLDYLEKHYNNVQTAWGIVKEALKNECCIYDDFRYFEIQDSLKEHDLSKLSTEELVPYRVKFYPTELEKEDRNLNEEAFSYAWKHHLECNDHHPETWVTKKHFHPYYREWACVQMICDLVAMSLYFKETSPRDFYNKQKSEMHLPMWAEDWLLMVCSYMEGAAHET